MRVSVYVAVCSLTQWRDRIHSHSDQQLSKTSVQAETVQEKVSYKDANFNVRSSADGKGPEPIYTNNNYDHMKSTTQASGGEHEQIRCDILMLDGDIYN